MSSVTDRLRAVIEPEVLAAGMDVEDISITSAGKNRVLKVAVDKDDGVGVDDIARASREVSRALDRAESSGEDILGAASYTLEVTSRGTEQPLTLPRHWRRNHGRLIDVKTCDGEHISGRIRHSDDAGATLVVNDRQHRIEYADVARAQIQVELNRKDS